MRVWPFLLLVYGGGAAYTMEPAWVMSERPLTTHVLTESCEWRAKPWAAAMGAFDHPRYTPETLRLTWRCKHARGLMSPSPLVNRIQPRWPTPAEFAAYERESIDAQDEAPLPAVLPATADDVPADDPTGG